MQNYVNPFAQISFSFLKRVWPDWRFDYSLKSDHEFCEFFIFFPFFVLIWQSYCSLCSTLIFLCSTRFITLLGRLHNENLYKLFKFFFSLQYLHELLKSGMRTIWILSMRYEWYNRLLKSFKNRFLCFYLLVFLSCL